MAKNIKEKTISGVIWSAFQKSGSIMLSFISSIILARLLTPEDYGCVGMLAIFMALSSTFIDGGFGSALIQKKRPTDEDYSTIFYWNLALSGFLYLVLFVSAPSIARFYHTEILCNVLRVQGVVLILNAARIVQTNQLRKQLRFKKIAVVDICVSALSLTITILMAWKGFGVWALVTQQIVVSVLSTTVYWITSKWRPILAFSKKSFKELFGFGGFILLSNLINTFCNNVQGLLIGRLYNPAMMGYYSKARGTEELASTFISQIMDQVAYPVLSEAQNNRDYLICMIRKFIGVLAFITFPLMLLLILLAKPIFVLLYSDKWLPSVPYFQILCIAGMAICLQGINYYAVAAIGKSDKLFKGTVIKRGLGLVLVIGGLIVGGIKGLLVGTVMAAWLVYLINAILVHKYVGYRLFVQLKDLFPIMLVSLFSFISAYLISILLSIGNMYIDGGIQMFIFISVYLLVSYLFKINALSAAKEIGLSLLHKTKLK